MALTFLLEHFAAQELFTGEELKAAGFLMVVATSGRSRGYPGVVLSMILEST